MTSTTPAAALREHFAVFSLRGSLGRDELLAAVTVLGEVQAVLDAGKVRVAGELLSRSVLAGAENPVTRAGHASPASLLGERWRIPTAAARQYCAVDEAVAPRLALTGEVLPARFPGGKAAAAMAAAQWQIATTIPRTVHHSLDGQTHQVSSTAIARELRAFFAA